MKQSIKIYKTIYHNNLIKCMHAIFVSQNVANGNFLLPVLCKLRPRNLRYAMSMAKYISHICHNYVSTKCNDVNALKW